MTTLTPGVASLAFLERAQRRGTLTANEEGHAISAKSEAGSKRPDAMVDSMAATNVHLVNSRAGEDEPHDTARCEGEGEDTITICDVPRRVERAAEHTERDPHIERATTSLILPPRLDFPTSLKAFLSFAPAPALDTVMTLCMFSAGGRVLLN